MLCFVKSARKNALLWILTEIPNSRIWIWETGPAAGSGTPDSDTEKLPRSPAQA